ncbi:MAG: hypothetical protein ABSA79_09920 [Candidatus Bathyarchaeia archaeon]|jgi:hypothetical protein
MTEKKLILCAILAITIGIATIMPIEYMMMAQAQQTNTQLPNVEPLSNGVNITYAYINPNKVSANDTMTLYGSDIQIVANFTLNPTDFSAVDAKVEYYKFAISSPQGPIFNMGYYIGILANDSIVTMIGGPQGTIAFANGITLNGPTSSDQDINYGCGGQAGDGIANQQYTLGYVSHFIFGTDPNNLPKAAAEIANAQTLYIDVSKICTVTVKGNVTVTTPASNQVIEHIELTKLGNGFGFAYGAYQQGTLPLPPGVGPSIIQSPTSTPSSNSTLSQLNPGAGS